jgi:small-conductance mechanosensitive channel
VTLETLGDLWLTIDPFLASSSAKTLLLVVLIGLLRILFSRTLDRYPELGSPESRRRWKVSVRNVALVLLIAGVLLIWAEELSSLMLSLVALGAAFVLAFKEVINCLSGTIVRTTTRTFGIGDRIEVAGLRGDVIDYTLLSTTLLEVGPGQQTHQYTGRAVILPNSLFLGNAVINETFTDDFVLHSFRVAISRAADWKATEKALLDAAWAECHDYIEAARTFMDQQAARLSLESMNVDPRVHLRLEDPDEIELVVRIAVPERRKGRVEQAILRRYLEATVPAAAVPAAPASSA